jgi:ribosome recycling factor
MNTDVINVTQDKMQKALESLDHRFSTVRAGRANPSSLDGINIDYYGSSTPLKQLATISVPEARQLLIKPFDRSSLGAIEKAIFESNLGYTPNNDGETIRIIIPVLTEDRRKELTKQVKSMAEDAKVSIRNIRRDSNEEIEKLEVSEDEQKNLQNQVQDLVNKYNKLIEDKLKEKENELMTV